MRIGVVAIGRNEGPRLEACLRSALRDASAVVYVDSGSSDGSVELARALGAHVVQLDLAIPFTAARSRNAGFERLLAVDPSMDAVQFVDGDCEIVPGWIARASDFLRDHPQAAVACGRRRERHPRGSVYNRLCDLEWNTPVGSVRSCGGDALIRVPAFRQVGGYDPSVIAGEEPELCVRLRAGGWTIHRLDEEMTLHDASMTRFSQWWRRNVRAGHAYAEGKAMHGAAPERHRVRETRSNWVLGLGVPIAASIAVVVLAAWEWRWCWIGLAPLLVYPLVFWRTRRSALRRGCSAGDATLYAAFVVLGKFPQALGQLTYHWNRRRGRLTRLIEYKGPAGVASC
jgi:glycosyltransferase involved in cell wall biosynthesis